MQNYIFSNKRDTGEDDDDENQRRNIFFADNDDCYTQLKDKFILSGINMMRGVGIRMSWFILISDKAY